VNLFEGHFLGKMPINPQHFDEFPESVSASSTNLRGSPSAKQILILEIIHTVIKTSQPISNP